MYLTACLNLCWKMKVERKTLLFTNYLSFFLLIACLNVTAGVYSQKVTLSGENISVKHVLKEIKKQTGYTFVYREVLLQKTGKVNVHVNKASVQQVLDACLKD